MLNPIPILIHKLTPTPPSKLIERSWIPTLTPTRILKPKTGFTFIEILVSMTITAVLMSIAVVAYTNTSKSSRDVKRRADLEAVQDAMMLYSAANDNAFPYAVGYTYDNVAAALVTAGYLIPPYPTDPSEQTSALFLIKPAYAALGDENSDPVYEYRYAGNATQFCICSLLETENGNSTTNANLNVANPNLTCSGLTGSGTKNYYCVKNQ